MEAVRDLSLLYGATAQFVDIAALCHQDITKFETVVVDIVRARPRGWREAAMSRSRGTGGHAAPRTVPLRVLLPTPGDSRRMRRTRGEMA